MTHCMVLVTCANESDAKTLASKLVTKKLAACVQIHPVTSIYTWEGNIHTDPEFRLIIKTRDHLYHDLEKHILTFHDYEVPQILQVPIDKGLTSYLNWIDENTL